MARAEAAETLREKGFDERVVLVADEAPLPYERPPLSKRHTTSSPSGSPAGGET